jgi:hypothetical protein
VSGTKDKKQRSSKEKAKTEDKEGKEEKKSNKSRSEGEGEEAANKIKRRRSFRLSRGVTNKAFVKEEEKAKEKESKQQRRLSKSTSAIASAVLTDRHVKSDGDEPEKGDDKARGSRIHHKKKAGQEGEVSKKKSTQVVDKELESSSFVTAADSSDNKAVMEKDRAKRKSKSDDEWERVKRLIDEAEAQKGRAAKEAEAVDDAVAYYAQKAETPKKDGAAASSFTPASSSSSSSSSRKRLTVSLGPGASPRSNAMGSNRMNTNARRVSNELNIKVQQFNIEKEGVFKSFKYQQLPPLRVKPLSSQSNVIELFGPSDEPGAANRAEMLPSGDVYCRAISTYPWDMHASAQAEKAAAAAVASDPTRGLNTNWSQVFEGVNVVSSADGKTKAGARPKVRSASSRLRVSHQHHYYGYTRVPTHATLLTGAGEQGQARGRPHLRRLRRSGLRQPHAGRTCRRLQLGREAQERCGPRVPPVSFHRIVWWRGMHCPFIHSLPTRFAQQLLKRRVRPSWNT